MQFACSWTGLLASIKAVKKYLGLCYEHCSKTLQSERSSTRLGVVAVIDAGSAIASAISCNRLTGTFTAQSFHF